MIRDFRVILAVLGFGAVALVGLVVLAAIGRLPGAVETTLASLAFGALTGAAGIAQPGAKTPAE